MYTMFPYLAPFSLCIDTFVLAAAFEISRSEAC